MHWVKNMSSLIVDVTPILQVEDHPNADRLSICTVKGWRVIAAKKEKTDGGFEHAYKSGDLIVYAPIDSVLPIDLSDAMQVTKYLSKGRVKTANLRGNFSQGLLIPLSFLPDPAKVSEGDDVREILGITKYEPPIRVMMSGEQVPEPSSFVRFSDVENIKNFQNVLQPDEVVVIREKIHGTNFRAANIEGNFFVGSHRTALKESDENIYWRAFKQYKLSEILQPGQQIFGEVYGHKVQKMAYGLINSIDLVVFALMEGGQYADNDRLENFCEECDLPIATKLYEGPWHPQLMELADGQTTIPGGDHLREGIVITPYKERWNDQVGRVILKHISESYLLKDIDDFYTH